MDWILFLKTFGVCIGLAGLFLSFACAYYILRKVDSNNDKVVLGLLTGFWVITGSLCIALVVSLTGAFSAIVFFVVFVILGIIAENID